MTTSSPSLARQLGLGDAVVIGLGSMIGAGIFAAFAPAAAAAGAGLLVGLAIAAIVAYCNASSSAQLAAQYPTSGGTYVYGRERLGDWAGFLAGWGFVIGKTASCAAMALTFAAYAAPEGWQKPVAVAAILALATVNYFGVSRTARLTRIIVVFVLAVLVLVVIAGLTATGTHHTNLGLGLIDHGWYGILQSAGLLFFAFAGYARIATMGEEVKNPARTIPKAILGALALTLVVYILIAVTLLFVLGPTRLASSTAPLADVITVSSWTWAAPIVRIGAAAAAGGGRRARRAGGGRPRHPQAPNRDLPTWLSAVHPVHKVPHHAEIALAILVSILILIVDLRGAIGFSSFGVLLYYFIANIAAFTQNRQHRRYPKPIQIIGALGCIILVATLPPTSIGIGIGVLVTGIIARLIVLRHRRTQT
jgi:APA family basic amino acid/polyamine antiporter